MQVDLSIFSRIPIRVLTYRAGVDMIATYAFKNFDEKLVRFGLALLDFDPTARGQFYK